MKSKLLPIALLIFSIFLIVIGVGSGQNLDVLQKATKICLECVGIG